MIRSWLASSFAKKEGDEAKEGEGQATNNNAEAQQPRSLR